MLPQVEGIKDKHEVLYLTDYVDEFAIMAIHEYKGKTFVNVTNESTDLSTDEEIGKFIKTITNKRAKGFNNKPVTSSTSFVPSN